MPKVGSIVWLTVFLIGTLTIWYTQATVMSDTAMLTALIVQAGWLFACLHGPSKLSLLGTYLVSLVKTKKDDNDAEPKL